jgi:homoprotocatechuate degradation regulator HpaR
MPMTDATVHSSAEFLQSLPILLLRAREAMLVRVRPVMRAYGLTEQQGRVLRTMVDMPPVDTAQLARRVFLLRPSLVRILRDLEARGLVERVAERPGLRRNLNVITDAGRALIAAAAVEAQALRDELERSYGSEAVVELKESLLALERALTRLR